MTVNIITQTFAVKKSLEQKQVAKECAAWIQQKVDVRSVKRPGFLHGKMYHIDNAGVQEALLGSSNFTVSGLGLGNDKQNNIKLNLEVDSKRDREDLLDWFNELWDDTEVVEDVKSEVLDYLEQMYENHSPEFIYFKTLYHIFEDYLKDAAKGGLLDEKTGFFETQVWAMLYEFQKDGVKGAINKILKHNGCVIADSVGLGKTFEALAVIKYFELRNERVLVLCPKKLRDNWTIYRENDTRNILEKDRFSYTVLSHTDLSRKDGCSGDINLATHNWGNYDLVVIDESHNFRNKAFGKRDEEGKLKLTRYERLMKEILQSGVETKVLLLSATPVNNSLKDLRNQIYLITQDKDNAFSGSDSLDIFSIAQVMKNAQTHFTNWADPKKNPERKVTTLMETLDSGFFKLLDELTIARSRRHIKNYYGTKEMGDFPKRLKNKAESTEIDTKGYFPAYDELQTEISKYKLSIFNPSAYLQKAFINEYVKEGEQMRIFNDQGKREFYLIGMMRVNYLKRLESSVHSFEVSIERTIQKIDRLLAKIDHFDDNLEDYIHPDLFEELDDNEMADLQDRLTVGKKLKIELKHIKREEWKADLRKDRKQLGLIHDRAAAVGPERDAKLKRLRELIKDKVSNPINDGNRKVIVFTAFSDTASYIYDNLYNWAVNELDLHIALVTGGGDCKTTFKPKGLLRSTEYSTILANFSPVSKNRDKMSSMPQEGEIDLLIATDCISEGQNLQDCDYLINYDIHWNPVRIIQRFGRIDRLGSTNKQIQLVNFWPTDDLNKYINLKDRVESRMALVDLTATGADNLLTTEQLHDLVKEELNYREKQLLRLKDEIIDLEEMDDNVSLSEFTLDDFRIELMNFMENNRELLRNAPLGLYAVTPVLKHIKEEDLFDKNWQKIIKPGVVFCLRHKKPTESASSAKVNPLGSHFLVYIRNDGTVRFNFTSAKKSLTLFQKLCAGKTEAYQALCDLFDQETAHGQDMKTYNQLLEKAVKAITSTFKKRVAISLQAGRNATIPNQDEQARDFDDFELVTWLVIK